ncbi:O-antigen ligase family protein [Rubrivirga sp.]|uniref:O-antigen ligase family protein n=1 Tax=Rubrivirga sp. TaxID=1885344 RepID=UPI003C757992
MDLTFTPPSTVRARVAPETRYLRVLSVCLLGYALFSRSFAYIGVPPLFIGEVLLAVGVFMALPTGQLGKVFESWAARLWLTLMVLVLVRTVPYLGTHGLDGPRDAMLVGYGIYAVIVASLLLAKPERIRVLVERYSTFVVVMLACAWLVFIVAKQLGEAQPGLPWAPHVKVVQAKGGDLMVHMTGIVAALILGLVRSTPMRWAMAAFSSGIIMVSNRGGMVAFVLGLGLAWLMRPRGAGVGKFVYAFVVLIVLGAIIGPMVQVEIQGGSRDLSVEQVVENVKSIFGRSSNALDGTKRWRLLWWTDIVNYTVNGPYFLQGKGFGINLATADGFEVGETGQSDLRSPHNGHLTVLARAGVPGFVLWVALHLSWFAAVLGAWARARRADRRRWQAVFAWVAGFWVAAMVNASFDVFIEGPMGAIWLWTVIGTGIAAVRLSRTHPGLLDSANIPLHDHDADARSAPRQPFSWH